MKEHEEEAATDNLHADAEQQIVDEVKNKTETSAGDSGATGDAAGSTGAYIGTARKLEACLGHYSRCLGCASFVWI